MIAGAVVAIAPARRAVSGWFRVGRIELDIDRRTVPTGLPSLTDAARQIEPSAADDLLGRPMPAVDTSSLGAPTLVDDPRRRRARRLARRRDVAVDVHTAGGEELVDKIVAAEADVTELPDLGDGGAAVRGSHVLQTPHRRVAADSVVIWADDGLTWRLEGTAELDELVDVASQLAG